MAAALEWSEGLSAVAQEHAEDMCARNFFNHTNPDGEGPQERADRHGLGLSMVSENLVQWGDVESAHALFMHEPSCMGHRGQVLDPRNLRVGIGITRCADDDERFTIVQNFEKDPSLPEALYCEGLDTPSCAMPPEPVTVATCSWQCEDALEFAARDWGCDCDDPR